MLFYTEGQGIHRAETIADEITSHAEPEWLIEELLIYFPDLIRRLVTQLDGNPGRADLERWDLILRRRPRKR